MMLRRRRSGDENAATTLTRGHDGNANGDVDNNRHTVHLKQEKEWTGKGGEFQ